MTFDPKQARHLIPGGNTGGPAIQTRGVMACYVVERREVPAMIWASDGGDHTAAQIRIGIGLWGETAFAHGAPRQRCATCDTTFESATSPEAFFLAIPQRGDGDSLVCGVCPACVRKIGSDGLLARAAETFKRVWPAAVVTGGGLGGR